MALTLKNIFSSGSDEVAQTYTIESWHISQSVDAFTGAVAYDITLSGSFTLTGSQYVSGSISASLGPNTVGFYGTSSHAVFSSNAISSSYALSSSYAVSSSYAASASYALSSSYAVSSSYAPTFGSYAASGSSVVTNTQLKFIGGASKTVGGTAGISLPELTGKTLGQTCFVSLALSSSAGVGALVQVQSLITGTLTFSSQPGDYDFYYTIIYI